MTQHTARIALVGDRSANVRAHARIPGLIEALLSRDSIVLDPYWIGTRDAVDCDLTGFDAIWIVPGSPYASAEGAIRAARVARTEGIPLLGTCGGFQHALLEYARDVCGLSEAENAEETPEAPHPLIVPLECSLMGHEEAVMIAPGTLAARICGAGRRVERYHCNYGLNAEYLETLTAGGLRFTGFDDTGTVRIMELPEHPFYIGTLFQPELRGDGTQPHPIIAALGTAASQHAAVIAGQRTLAG